MPDVTVVYCPPGEIWSRPLRVDEGDTVRVAIERSGVLAAFPGLRIDELSVGVFSRPRSLDSPLQDGDRVEIYRPLVVDPMEARRRRAALRRRKAAPGAG